LPTNILNLPTYIVTKLAENDNDYHIDAEAKDHPVSCQSCGEPDIVGFGRHEQLIRDLPMHGKRVGIYVDTRRYRCRACNKTFYERLPEVDDKRMMTLRLAKWIGKQSVKRPFAHIAEEIGLTENTIKNVFNDHIKELGRTVKFDTPQWMGIDEIHIIGRPRCVITNIENGTVFNVLRDRNKKTVTDYLIRLEDRDTVKLVAMDMWEPYRDAVRAAMPQAIIVIDKFHVVRMANSCLEVIRKSLREGLTNKQRRGLMHDRFVLLRREDDLEGLQRINLESWTKNYPVLGAAYRAKEDFFDIYNAETAKKAQAMFTKWESTLAPEIKDAFYPLVRASNNWMPEIMAYFNNRVTNAYTESLNNLIRLTNRIGRGYSFEALRAKILFTEGVCKIKKPGFHRPGDETLGMVAYADLKKGVSTEYVEREINYGADISTLIRLLEEGKL